MEALAQQPNFNMPAFDVNGRYAYALFSLGNESGNLQQILTEIGNLRQLMEESNELVELFENKSFSSEVKMKTSAELSKRVGFNEQVTNFISLIIKNGRSDHMAAIIESFQALCDAHNKIIHVKISTATKLNEDQQTKLQNLCSVYFGSKVKIEFDVDATLIGGVKLALPNNVIDSTLAAKFSQLEDNFIDQFPTT